MIKNINILITDDETTQVELLSGFFKKRGYNLFNASNVDNGLEIVKTNPIDIIISDFRMPNKTGFEFLSEIKKFNPEIDFIMLTAFGTLESAVESMKLGAYDFISKPIDLEELDLKLERLIEKRNLKSENNYLKEQFKDQYKIDSIISASAEMNEVVSLAVRAAESRATILLTGESGTGKEVIAKAIHLLSSRKENPFIAINIPALPESLLESELFGYEKGAFTGADKLKKGKFELADNGTIFLDEIGDMPMLLQVKLLRVLQEQEVERIGSNKPFSIDVRIIAATNKNLEKKIQDGSFRLDLYYRLNVITINIPPLRERRNDIPLLIEHFLKKFSKQNIKPDLEISKEAMDFLLKYHYPGNIRELINIIERAVVLCRNKIITQNDLPLMVRGYISESQLTYDLTSPLNEQIELLEKKLILHALEKTNNNQTQAGKILGLPERNLRYKIKKYGL